MNKSHLDPAWFNAPTENEDLKDYIAKKVLQFNENNLQNNEVQGSISALIVPHAGYVYSLDTALQAYALLKKEDYDRVLILSPSHAYPFLEEVGIEPVARIETVCGEISFDKDFSDKLKSLSPIVENSEASKAEHSIHIQLPLVRYFLGDIPVAGLMFGKWQYNKSFEDFAKEMYELLDSYEGGIGHTLILISSDFTHYGQKFNYEPFKGNADIEKDLYELDHTVYHTFASLEIPLFEGFIRSTKASVCGAVALKFLMALLPEKAKFREIAYTSSGALMQDFTHSVSYLSCIVSANWAESTGFYKRLPEYMEKSRFTALERYMIADIAKKAVQYAVEHKAVAQVDYATIPPKLMEQGAVFVTLELQGRLRGCIGDIVPTRPLIDSILQRAYSAALEDSRFNAVEMHELGFLTVEVSVLSPPIPVENYKAIEIYKHGIILHKEQNSAVFLPHVAKEQGWTLEETLNNLAEKAGLEQGAWKDNCKFYVFTAEKIHD